MGTIPPKKLRSCARFEVHAIPRPATTKNKTKQNNKKKKRKKEKRKKKRKIKSGYKLAPQYNT